MTRKKRASYYDRDAQARYKRASVKRYCIDIVIDSAMHYALITQAQAEDTTPGALLRVALSDYLRARGHTAEG